MEVNKLWRACVSVSTNAEFLDTFTNYDFDHELTEDEIMNVFDLFEKDYPLMAVNELQVTVKVVYYTARYHLRKRMK